MLNVLEKVLAPQLDKMFKFGFKKELKIDCFIVQYIGNELYPTQISIRNCYLLIFS